MFGHQSSYHNREATKSSKSTPANIPQASICGLYLSTIKSLCRAPCSMCNIISSLFLSKGMTLNLFDSVIALVVTYIEIPNMNANSDADFFSQGNTCWIFYAAFLAYFAPWTHYPLKRMISDCCIIYLLHLCIHWQIVPRDLTKLLTWEPQYLFVFVCEYFIIACAHLSNL